MLAFDLLTGEQSLLHDGSPEADGSRLACLGRASFDSRARRLLIELDGGFDCPPGISAVDADTGAHTRLIDF